MHDTTLRFGIVGISKLNRKEEHSENVGFFCYPLASVIFGVRWRRFLLIISYYPLALALLLLLLTFLFLCKMNNVSPQLLNALSHAILQNLRRDSGRGNLAALLNQVAVAPASPLVLTPGPDSPEYVQISDVRTPGGDVSVDDSDGATLGRQSSTASTSSISSTSSTSSNSSNSSIASQHEWEDNRGDYLIKRRRPSTSQKKADRRVVTAPVLAKIDAQYLAIHPDVNNPLFRRRFKKARGPNGERKLKKNKDIVIPVFKQLVGGVLRTLALRHLRAAQQADPAVTYNDLHRRFFMAALEVTKRRRGNHVQNWRPEISGTHLSLIYSGVQAAGPFSTSTPATQTTPATVAPTTPATPKTSRIAEPRFLRRVKISLGPPR